MTAAATLATAGRVLRQLRRDPRTLALLLVVPCALQILLKYVLDGQPETFDRIGGPLLGLFPFITMFLVTSITMLRERTTGTLERLMPIPIAKLDLLLGYGIAFGAVAAVQAALTTTVAFGLLDLSSTGSELAVVVFAIANAQLGMSLGLFVSAFANTEFQAVQFLPAMVFPQLLLCGLLVPRDQMAPVLEAISNVLPLTYAYEGLERVTTGPGFDATAARDLAIVLGVTVLALGVGATTLRRRTG
ncbi:MAG: ABC transporter permease [Gaiellales bacterium]